MYLYAQTNLQLYNQVRQANYPESDFMQLAKAYELAMELFTGRYRANGKPFLAHLVGTASILVAQSAPMQVAIAGLLHAAYAQGDFGHSQFGITTAKRKYVKRFVSREVENLITQYTLLPWKATTLVDLRQRLTSLSEIENQVILMRLANELEDYLDLGMLYCQKDNQVRKGIDPQLMIELAQAFGYINLANHLEEVYEQTAVSQVPLSLCRTETVSFATPRYFSRNPNFLTQCKNLLKQILPPQLKTSLKQVRSLVKRERFRVNS